MSRYRRSKFPGATYFFTLVTHHRRRLLADAEVITALRTALKLLGTRYPFSIDAMVVLSDHLHAVWTLPETDADYGKRISLFKRSVSQQVRQLLPAVIATSSKQRRELNLWQRRFWEHQIRDDFDYERHVDYLHYNPVKHGLVQAVADWPYSTFQRFVRAGVYPLNWGGSEVPLEGEFGE